MNAGVLMKSKKIALCLALSSSVALAIACSSSSSESPGTGTPDAGGPAPTGPNDGGTGNGPDPGVDANVPPNIAAACSAIADAVCTRVESCSPFALGASYKDLATCKQRQALWCASGANAKGASAASADGLTACASSISTVACTDILTLNLGPACTFAGTSKNGDACGYDAECESTHCALGTDQSCGKCAPPTQAGDSCSTAACGAGFVCSEVDSKCYARGTAKVGGACSRRSDCDLQEPAGCNSLSGKCLALDLSTNGKCAANSIVPTKFTVCPGGAICSRDDIAGQCSAIAADGEACAAKGPGCVAPARCVSGKCTLPSQNCQ